jgi:LysR family cys regulon transcriptional activator
MLHDARNIKTLAEQYSQRDIGQLTVVTTHTQARYALPNVIAEFKKAFPKVHLKLHQGSPQEIVHMLLEGEADIGIATEAVADVPDLASFPFYRWHHALVVPYGHALLERKPLTLEAIAEYPIITYHEGFTGRTRIDKAFSDAGVAADVVMSALDADVIKTYVEVGLGVGIMASVAFNPLRDTRLQMINAQHLFPENVTNIGVRKGHYLRGYAYRFIELCSPGLDEQAVRGATNPARDNDEL